MTEPLHTHTVTPNTIWQGPQGECPWCRATGASEAGDLISRAAEATNRIDALLSSAQGCDGPVNGVSKKDLRLFAAALRALPAPVSGDTTGPWRMALENAARMAEQGVLSMDGGQAAVEIRALAPDRAATSISGEGQE